MKRGITPTCSASLHSPLSSTSNTSYPPASYSRIQHACGLRFVTSRTLLPPKPSLVRTGVTCERERAHPFPVPLPLAQPSSSWPTGAGGRWPLHGRSRTLLKRPGGWCSWCLQSGKPGPCHRLWSLWTSTAAGFAKEKKGAIITKSKKT